MSDDGKIIMAVLEAHHGHAEDDERRDAVDALYALERMEAERERLPPSEERVDPLEVVLQLRAELAATQHQNAANEHALALTMERRDSLTLELAAANERADKNARLLLEAISISDMRRKTLFDKSNEFRDEWKRAEEAEAQRDAARQDLASAVEVLRDFTPGLGKLGPWDRWERARTLIARFDAQGGENAR